MLFSKNIHTKKQIAIVLVLLIALTAIPLLTAQASVSLLYFRGVSGANAVTLEWATAQELDNLGFNLYRSQTSDFDDAVPLNSGLIPGNTGSTTGETYEWPDTNVVVGVQYTYWLEDLDINGTYTLHDPITASATGGGAIPTQPNPGNNTATPTPTRTPTRTPTPTTQSQSGTTATPTTTRSATATASSANPTATSQTQATAVNNNTNTGSTGSTGNQAQSTTVSSNSNPPPTVLAAQEGAAPTETPETVDVQEVEGAQEELQEEISQLPTEGETNEGISNATQIGIGQGGQEAEETGQPQNSDGGSNRSTAVLMALIASIVLLLAGVGGVVVLLINKNKQSRT